MSRFTRKERKTELAEDAASWLVALQADELSSEERAEFIDWLRESPIHVAEMLHTCRVHRDLSLFEKWSAVAPFVPREASRVLPLAQLRRSGVAIAPAERVFFRRILSAGACAVAAAIAIPFLWTWYGESSWQTQLGERREVTLVDGSVVDLAPESKIRVRYADKSRSVVLERGEVLFHVAKDASRPFIVQAAQMRVRAVGTVFNVAESQQGLSVTVVEGRVTVSDKRSDMLRSSSRPVVSLGVDEQLLVSSAGTASPIRKVKGEMEVAWATGQLIFDSESIAEIARRFNLYNRTQIRVTDKELGERRLGGVFRATDPESFVAFVVTVGGVAVSRPNPNLIVLGNQQAASDASPDK
jgi:transmembrane sensor